MDVFKMAWRNVWRNRRRTIVTVAAMSFALLIMMLYTGFMEWYIGDMEQSVLDLEVGDVQIFAGDYREDPSIYTLIERPEELLDPLEEAGFPASPRLLAFGLAASGDASAGVSFRGIDVERDARVSLVHEELAAGQWLDPAEPNGVVLGRRLARTLAVEPGGELLVLSQGADGSLAYDLYTVRGVLKGIGDATDRSGVFMTAETFRELMVVPNGVHKIIVRRPTDVELDAAALQVQRVAREHDVQTWRQLMPTISSMIDSARSAMYVMSFIIYIAVGILILNAMLMAVFERIREFGVLKALGVGPTNVLGLIAIEGAIQTGIAIAVGTGLGLAGLYYLSSVGLRLDSLAGVAIMGIAMDPVWRAAISPTVIAGPIAILVVIVFLAVLYPALKASWIQPVEAMRYR